MIFFTRLRVFHTKISWRFSTGDCVIESLLKSPGLNLVFWLISTMLLFGWTPLVLIFLCPPVHVLCAPIIIGITVTYMFHSFFNSLAVQVFIALFAFLQFYPIVSRFGRFSFFSFSFFFSFFFFCPLLLGLVVGLRLDDPFVSQNPREFCASDFPGQVPGCAYTI